jgi:CDP-paratose 2-epimerase
VKIIVTGVAGFIGTTFASRVLSSACDCCIGIDDLSRRGATENLAYLDQFGSRLAFHRGDIRDHAFVNEVVRRHADADAIVHLAAQTAVTTSVADPRHDFEVNAAGTFNVLEAVRQHAPAMMVLYASTNKVYGGIDHEEVRREGDRYGYVARPEGINETCPLDFHSPYGCSKGAADQYVRDYARIYGLKTVVFRQSCIYGPRQFGFEEQGWVAWFTIATALSSPITIYGDGYQTRDLLWVEDLCDLYLAAIGSPDRVAGQVYNVGGGRSTARSVREVLSELERISGRSILPKFGDWRPGDQRVFIADVAKAHRELGWAPKTSPQEGIRLLATWTRENIETVGRVAGAGVVTR